MGKSFIKEVMFKMISDRVRSMTFKGLTNCPQTEEVKNCEMDCLGDI